MTVGRSTTVDDIDYVLGVLTDLVEKLRRDQA
jgi:cysteine sulfinate desulfinase/cysteine desulfurase-like protein